MGWLILGSILTASSLAATGYSHWKNAQTTQQSQSNYSESMDLAREQFEYQKELDKINLAQNERQITNAERQIATAEANTAFMQDYAMNSHQYAAQDLEKAGLSKTLAAGSTVATPNLSTGSVGSVGSVNTAKVSSPSYSGQGLISADTRMMSAILDAYNLKNQSAKNTADIDLIQSQIHRNDAQTLNEMTKNMNDSERNKIYKDYFKATIKNKNESLSLAEDQAVIGAILSGLGVAPQYINMIFNHRLPVETPYKVKVNNKK